MSNDDILDLLETWGCDPDLMIEDLGHSRLLDILRQVALQQTFFIADYAQEVLRERKDDHLMGRGEDLYEERHCR